MKRIALVLIFSMLFLSCAGIAEKSEPEETGANGKVIIVDEAALDAPRIPEAEEPFCPEGLEKAIIGTDNRITVTNPARWPYSAIAYMEVTAECGDSWQASGFLVGKDGILLSAAHCLVCSEHSKWAEKITFFFGYKNRKNYAYKYTDQWEAYVGNIFAYREYSTLKDYAVVKIDRKVPEKVGCFGASWGENDTDIRKRACTVAGYRDGTLRYDRGFLDVLDSDHVSFTMDAVPGNSGCPIYTQDGRAVGIFIADQSDRRGSPEINIGYRLTGEVWSMAQEYRYK